jgi:hypothetical protein
MDRAVPLIHFFQGVRHTISRLQKRARAELVDLIESQLTLEKETFGCVTEAELCEYEDRRDRICLLYAEVIDRETAA